MPEILKDLPIVDILNTGLAGFCLLVALFGYLLLRSEQRKEEPRQAILGSIESFTKKTLLFALIVAGASVAALVGGHSFDKDGDRLKTYLASLPETVRADNPQKTAALIRETLTQLDNLKRIPALENEIADLEERLDALQLQNRALGTENAEIKRQLAALDGNFLVKIARLNIRLNEFGGSINPYYPFDERKRQVNRQIQDLLAELNYCATDPDGDRVRTRDDLIAYQKAKGFSTVGFFAYPTIRWMIVDYLNHGEESEATAVGRMKNNGSGEG